MIEAHRLDDLDNQPLIERELAFRNHGNIAELTIEMNMAVTGYFLIS